MVGVDGAWGRQRGSRTLWNGVDFKELLRNREQFSFCNSTATLIQQVLQFTSVESLYCHLSILLGCSGKFSSSSSIIFRRSLFNVICGVMETQQEHPGSSPHGQKRHPDDELESEQRLAKRFNLLRIGKCLVGYRSCASIDFLQIRMASSTFPYLLPHQCDVVDPTRLVTRWNWTIRGIESTYLI